MGMKSGHTTAIIIGAGPAGLAAAYELLDKTDIIPLVYEASDEIGGLSRTIVYKSNRIDIGGHRFFSKSDKVMSWWTNILPLQGAPARDDKLIEREMHLATTVCQRKIGSATPVTKYAPDPEQKNKVMLIRNRLSRILFRGKFFGYPVTLSTSTILNLGIVSMIRILASYLHARIFPIKDAKSLEDFYINQFGAELYRMFFRDYTHKVWGIPCTKIPKDWGAQRVKGLSLLKLVEHALRRIVIGKNRINSNSVETSLIESFIYPKYGPGQLWETVAEEITSHGGSLFFNSKVVGIVADGNRVTGVEVENTATGERSQIQGDYIISTMPIRDLIAAFRIPVPADVQRVSDGLLYRDFITVGVLAKQLQLKNTTKQKTINNLIPDNWIYIQEPGVQVGRLQLFNNWSPYMVANPDTVWLGMEYFCNQDDELWSLSDSKLTELAVSELGKIGVASPADIIDTTVIRVQKAYPAYFGAYKEFDTVRDFTDRFTNLFLIGRNGMHRYNNMDHSVLSAMTAVQNIIIGIESKDDIWTVNSEEAYHESK